MALTKDKSALLSLKAGYDFANDLERHEFVYLLCGAIFEANAVTCDDQITVLLENLLLFSEKIRNRSEAFVRNGQRLCLITFH